MQSPTRDVVDTRTLLVIEDSVDDRLALRRLLSQVPKEFEVIVELGSAEEGLEYLSHERPDCCLLDHHLPGMSGLSLLKEIRGQFREDPLPVVILTGQGDEVLAAALMQHGAQDYLIKNGLNARRLMKTIHHAMHQCSMQRELNRLAYYDSLTSLLNRPAIIDRINESIARAQRKNEECTLFYMDLDHFKKINDSLGHDAGDELLKRVAQRIRSNVRESDIVGRLGGDEFVVLLEGVDVATSDSVAHKVISEICKPIDLSGAEVSVNCSIGIAHFPETAKNSREILKYADVALYEAKKLGRARYHHFSPQQKKEWLRRKAIESALPHALKQQELHFLFLPTVSVPDKRLTGFELLTRWEAEHLPQLQASELIAMIESLRLLEPFNEYLFEFACIQLREWQKNRLDWRLSLNIAGEQWQHDNLVSQLRQRLQRFSFDPQRLELELNQRLLTRHPKATAQLMAQLRNLGVRLVLDDLGAGNVSLRDLAALPLDGIKIDRQFWIGKEVSDDRDRKVIQAAVALGRGLGLEVTAKGVEGEAQWVLAQALGSDYAQGFWLGKPTNDWRSWLE